MKNRLDWIMGALLAVTVTALALALGIPSLLRAIERGKCKRFLFDLEAVRTVIEQYRVDVGSYPAAIREEDFRAALEPKYFRRVPEGIDFFSDGQSYALFSHYGSACWFEFRDGHYVSWPSDLDARVKAVEASRAAPPSSPGSTPPL